MSWMIYGANGYTGELIAREAVARGMRPVLAGRNRKAIESLGKALGLETQVFALDADLISELQGHRLVLHCAGPFSVTSAPMIEACLASNTHYLDITGEIDVFEHAWNQDERARKADVLLCPGVGFDVVPTDCLAAGLVSRLPAATSLILAFEAGGGPSRGTAKTSVEGLGKGGRIRENGELRRVPSAWKSRQIPFPGGERSAVTIPWGDVFTAWVSTGIPNIQVYMSMSPAAINKMKRLASLGPILSWGLVQGWLRRQVGKRISGPDESRRADTGVQVWGEASSADGRRVEASLTGPNGYDMTVTASLGIVEKLLEKTFAGGFMTPSLLMGPDYAATLPGVKVSWGEPVTG